MSINLQTGGPYFVEQYVTGEKITIYPYINETVYKSTAYEGRAVPCY